jgi:hypothetical protein
LSIFLGAEFCKQMVIRVMNPTTLLFLTKRNLHCFPTQSSAILGIPSEPQHRLLVELLAELVPGILESRGICLQVIHLFLDIILDILSPTLSANPHPSLPKQEAPSFSLGLTRPSRIIHAGTPSTYLTLPSFASQSLSSFTNTLARS